MSYTVSPTYTLSVDSGTGGNLSNTSITTNGSWRPGTGTTAVWTATTPYTIPGTVTGTPYVINQNGKIDITGPDADISLNGKSLKTWMEAVEQRLNILQVNSELEAEWEELRKLGNAYRELELRIQEKQKTWKILSKK